MRTGKNLKQENSDLHQESTRLENAHVTLQHDLTTLQYQNANLSQKLQESQEKYQHLQSHHDEIVRTRVDQERKEDQSIIDWVREENMRLREEIHELKSSKVEEGEDVEVECENCVRLEVDQLLSDIAPILATLPPPQGIQYGKIRDDFSEFSLFSIGELVRMRNELRKMILAF